ncbi:MAG: hypothetical protein COA70_05655 [Planctomycetota bacterium]|nr:MAG: hypothetical protein COA70_05655 [Planctomycetota bacterium]
MLKLSSYRPMTAIGAILFLLATPAFAQTVGGGSEQLYQWNGGSDLDSFGESVSTAGDVNGDGFPDVIVGAWAADPGGLADAGSAYAYSGADGSLLYQWDGAAAGDNFGYSVSGAGDVNGDGFADVIVGAWAADPGGFSQAGSAYVYSGANGSLLYQWDGTAMNEAFGISVSDAGEVNGDGFADVIVGSYWASPGGLALAGSAYVYSGASGSLLHQWDGAATFDRFGVSVSSAGDVNSDGAADLIVGAHTADPGGLSSAGSAYVYSGANGLLLYQWNGGAADDLFGFSVSDAGDVNADGFADVIVSGYAADPGGLNVAGSAYVYSGANGSLLHQWDGEAEDDLFGYSVSGAGDVNGDGFSDVIISAYVASPGMQMNAGSAYLYSGADGVLLYQWDGSAAFDFNGVSVSAAGDIDGDGFADVIVGANGADPGGLNAAGSVYVYSFHPYLLANTSTIPAAAGAVLDLTLDFPDSAAFQDYITLMSITGTGPIFFGVGIPLSIDSFLLDSATGVYPFAITSNLHGTLDASGNASASITFPAGVFNFAIGRTFWLAAVSLPTGLLPTHSSVVVATEIVP